jgi:hypothetical protein
VRLILRHAATIKGRSKASPRIRESFHGQENRRVGTPA